MGRRSVGSGVGVGVFSGKIDSVGKGVGVCSGITWGQIGDGGRTSVAGVPSGVAGLVLQPTRLNNANIHKNVEIIFFIAKPLFRIDKFAY